MYASLVGFISLQLSESEDPAIFVRVTPVNADSGLFCERISEVLHEIRELEIKRFGTPAESEAPVAKGQASAAIIIPADSTDKIGAYEPTGIKVVVDPGQPQAASIVAGIMNKVADEAAIGERYSMEPDRARGIGRLGVREPRDATRDPGPELGSDHDDAERDATEPTHRGHQREPAAGQGRGWMGAVLRPASSWLRRDARILRRRYAGDLTVG
jgi:hypothetical protein